MSLNDWSIVIFISSAIYYLAIYYTMFRNPNTIKFFLLTIIWVFNSFVTLIYGMATNQIGFIMLFLLEWAMIIAVFIQSGKVLNNVD